MRRWFTIFLLAMTMQGINPSLPLAENEPHPAKAWRPMTMVDLRLVGPHQLSSARLWNDRLAPPPSSNGGSVRSPVRSTPAKAANIVIRSPEVVVLLSILHSDHACDPRAVAPQVWRCPMRLARFDPNGTTIREGKACFAQSGSGGIAPLAYASYDPGTRAIRLGVVAGGEAVEGCSQSVPVKGE